MKAITKNSQISYKSLIFLVNVEIYITGHSRPQDLLCYAKTNNKLGSNELWLSLWGCLAFESHVGWTHKIKNRKCVNTTSVIVKLKV